MALPPLDPYRMQVRDLSEYAMFMLDPEGTLVSWNAGVERLLGYSEEEWIGRHASFTFAPAENAREIFELEMEKARETGSAPAAGWHLRKDGATFFADGVLHAVRDESGSLVGYAKILSDDTVRKRLQDSLTEANTALEQFAFVTSHDLQEPLRTIGFFAQLLTRKYTGQLDREADQCLSFIVSAAARMSALIQGLLVSARRGNEEEQPSSVALDEDLETAITLLAQSITESGATVTHDPLPTVRVNRGEMVRLFQNLIGNAVKYHKAGESPEVHIAAEQRAEEWVLSVADNGIGFDPQFASNIFTPFTRLHTAQEYPGTGVGLAICSRIVQAQGGRIWAESEPGEGSTFFFTLPVEGHEPAKHIPPMHIADRP